ncbi:MAG: hypothetical protein Q9214_002602, partial [Letrouitia sp. 1 TL-2023]
LYRFSLRNLPYDVYNSRRDFLLALKHDGRSTFHQSSLRRNRMSSANACQEGNPDFYGLGIRVGIYLQWSTAILANYLHTDGISENLDTNAIFLLALFVALATATAGAKVRPEEVAILLQLCFGFLLAVLSIWGHRLMADKRKKPAEPVRFPLMGSFFRLTLATAICAYAVWYWFVGVKKLEVAECPAYIFMFAKANIGGGIRTFLQVQTVLIMIPLGTVFLAESLNILWFYSTTIVITLIPLLSFAIYETWRGDWWSFRDGVVFLVKKAPKIAIALSWARANGKQSSGPKRPDLLPWLLVGTQVGLALWMKVLNWILSKLAVELTLKWNNISNVHDIRSTGQLIPFVIGIVSLLSLLQGISVRNSDVRAYDAIMELFDYDQERKHEPYLETDLEAYPLANGKEAIFGFPKDVVQRHSFDEYKRSRDDANLRDLERHSLDCDQSLDQYIDKLGPHVYEEDEFVRCRMTRGRQVVFVDDSQKSYKYQLAHVRDDESLNSSSDNIERTPIERFLLYISRAVLKYYNTYKYMKDRTSQNEVTKGSGLSPTSRSTPHASSSSTLSSTTQAESTDRKATTSLELKEREANEKSKATDVKEKAEKEKLKTRRRAIRSHKRNRQDKSHPSVYKLALRNTEDLSKLFHRLQMNLLGDTAAEMASAIRSAKLIREERAAEIINREQQLDRIRALRADLSVKVDLAILKDVLRNFEEIKAEADRRRFFEVGERRENIENAASSTVGMEANDILAVIEEMRQRLAGNEGSRS